MKKKIIVTLVCVGIIAFVVFKLASNKKKINEKNQPAQVEDVRIPVTATPVSEEIQDIELIKTGMLAPFKEAKVLSVSSGNIQRLLFKLGDHVQQGQTLAVIDTRLLEIDLQKAESNASKLKRDLQTYTELLEGSAATQEKVNDIRQSYNDAQSLSQQLRRQIADATIKSPISGIIGNKAVEEGMFITAGGEIGSIVNLSQLKVEVYFTEAEVYQIKVGQKIKLTTDVYPDKPFYGTITFISPQANQAYNYQVEITANNDKNNPLRSGTFIYADFSRTTPQKVLLIPREALNASTQDASVYIAKDGKAVLRTIKVGAEFGSKIQVTEGLQTGEQVITSGQINLKDGTLINISK
ncbi:efflux RND transporter periplasmic adaptor subunit [Sphingobacterium corticibacter]|uniref:Efflux transporter periplasmic adaptor subunit n=1 Tax=Sphingobacterium corticibacter TaxID=2171749 RepID=A0A2T8HN85_9SPHI|nr:efflux RND transporter periplasmic adaptor subunit [Sphingobacterium corticibacter]PVH26875.1 efflux transporter periplasmic adaptor subunit [Sphingobacterium corticibacter]